MSRRYLHIFDGLHVAALRRLHAPLEPFQAPLLLFQAPQGSEVRFLGREDASVLR